MSDRTATLDRIEQAGVIAVLRGISTEDAEPIGTSLAAGGLTAMEVTAETPGATHSIECLTAELADRDVLVGAGTVLDAASARAVVDAGASFIVTPALDADVVRAANRAGVPVIPGVMTPTEAVRAYELGADAVKLFPASTVGPSHVAALRGPLPHLDIVPTGGISRENVGEYIAAGAFAVGVGSALLDDDILATSDWSALERRASSFVEAVADARG